MSDATILIRRALDAGIQLRFVDGQLKVIGKRKAVECWASKLRENKAALIKALQPPIVNAMAAVSFNLSITLNC